MRANRARIAKTARIARAPSASVSALLRAARKSAEETNKKVDTKSPAADRKKEPAGRTYPGLPHQDELPQDVGPDLVDEMGRQYFYYHQPRLQKFTKFRMDAPGEMQAGEDVFVVNLPKRTTAKLGEFEFPDVSAGDLIQLVQLPRAPTQTAHPVTFSVVYTMFPSRGHATGFIHLAPPPSK
jgi:hypothetical protein